MRLTIPSGFSQLSGALLELHQGANLSALPEVFLRALRKLIDADIYTVDLIDLRRMQGSYLTWPPSIPDANTDVLNAHLHEHPSLKMITQPEEKPVAMWSDFVTLRQFRQTGLYHDFYRCSGTKYQIAMAFSVDTSATVCVVFNRRLRNFTEEDRMILQVAEPHFSQAYRQAKERTEMEHALALRSMLDCDRAVLVGTMDGELVCGTPEAMRLCREWFGEFPEGQLPAALRKWVASGRRTPGPLVRERDYRRLEVVCGSATPLIQPAGFLRTITSQQLARVIQLSERRVGVSPEKLLTLGLTPREAEVLSWVAQGKRNAEIATILGSHPRTVGKHVEHLLQKLGVENRGAAAAVAWDAMSGSR